MPDTPKWAMRAADAIGVALDDWLTAQGLRHIPLPPPSDLAAIILYEHDADGHTQVEEPK